MLGTFLATGGRYLYFGDTGGNIEGAYVLVSDTPGVAEPTDFTLIGTPGNDIIRLGVAPNEHLQFVNTKVYARASHDSIFGAFGDDKLYGEAGKDLLSGGPGNDWLAGGTGKDKLIGGAGDDVFVFDTKLSSRSNVDQILSFDVKHDSIYLEDSVFTKLRKGSPDDPVKLNKGAFWKGHAAHDATDRIIYDKSTGALYYDRDGTGAAGQVKFAQLTKGLKMTHHDFFVI